MLRDMRKPIRRGDVSYKKAGFTKPILVHVSPGTHARLMKIAEKEERSLQITVRRILEEYLSHHK
jgi:predicted HicB family RNase H-like nuclease